MSNLYDAYHPIDIQAPYEPLYEARKKIILVTGGRGSGKSFNVALFLNRLSFERGHKMLFCRYTMSSASKSVIPEFTEKMELEGSQDQFDVTKTEIANLFSDSIVMFSGIKTSSGNQTANLKSIQGLTTFVGDEMEEWVDEDDFDKLRLSVRKKGIQNRIILVMNPTDSEHFVYKKYIENSHKIVTIDGVDVQISTHPDVLHIHTSYLDNLSHVDEDWLNEVRAIRAESIKQCTGLDGKLDKKKFQFSKYATTIIGRWTDTPQGAIIQNWREGEFDESLPYGYGQDYGWSVDPDTLIRVAVDRKKKYIYVDEEYYDTKHLSTDDIYNLNISRIKKKTDLIVGDSSEGRLIEDLRKKGLNIKEAEKGPDSVRAGLAQLNEYTIIVTPRSKNIKKEFRNYKWNDKKAGIPIDKYNHSVDAIRYICRFLIGKPKGIDPRSIPFG